MTDLVRVAESVSIPVDMLPIWERLSELAVEQGPVFETNLKGLGINLRPICHLNYSIGGGEQAISFGHGLTAEVQFILRKDIYRAMIGTVVQ
jgi:hypothetical protein